MLSRENVSDKEFKEFLGTNIYEYFLTIKKDSFKNTEDFIEEQWALYKGLTTLLADDDKNVEKFESLWGTIMCAVTVLIFRQLVPAIPGFQNFVLDAAKNDLARRGDNSFENFLDGWLKEAEKKMKNSNSQP